MSKDIESKNEAGKLHGYCEYYFSNGQLMWKGVMVNGSRYSYHEDYNSDGSAFKDWTGYYIGGHRVSSDNEEGCCYIWCKEAV